MKDDLIHLLQKAHFELDKAVTAIGVTFFDAPVCFTPASLSNWETSSMQLDAPTMSWIVDYLSNRQQLMKLLARVLEMVVSRTGAQQGTVLSNFLFTLYTLDFQ